MESSEAEPKKILNRMAVMLLVTGLVVGIAVGYGASYLVYQQEISGLQISLSTVQSDLSIAQAEVSSLESEISKSQEESIVDTSLLVNKSLPFEATVGDNLVLGKNRRQYCCRKSEAGSKRFNYPEISQRRF